MRVLYLSNIPAPYTVERFNTLAGLPELDFSAGFLERSHADRSWSVEPPAWEFPYVFTGTGTKGARACSQLVRSIRPDVLVTLYERVEFLAGLAAATSIRSPSVLHALKTFDTWTRRRTHRELAKHILFRRVDLHVCGPDSRGYVESYGARPGHIHVLAEPVNVSHFETGSDLARNRGDRLAEGVVFLYVGRLWRGKGLDFLLQAFEQLEREGVDASLVLVGDGVDEERYRARAGSMQRVRFMDFVQAADLPAVYGAADVLVFPTLGDPYGYVVEEAMASRLPVISTVSAGDISGRVADGETGLLVPPADADALATAMRTLASDAGLRRAMGEAGRRRVAPRTIEWWSHEFSRMVVGVGER